MDRSLDEAARTGNVKYLLSLMRENPLLLEVVVSAGAQTPLHIASLCGHLDFVKKVLELKYQFAYELNQDGYTPLHLASAAGHLEVVVELLKLGNDLCIIQGKEQRIPLHLAVVKGRTHVIKELLFLRPDSVEIKTAGGETALHLAVKNNQFGSLRLMVEHLIELKKEAVLNEKDNQGNTILHLAVLRKQYEVVDLLLSGVAVTQGVMEVNSKNESSLSPLDVLRQFQSVLQQFQSEAGDLQIETTLLKAGAIRSEGTSSSVELEPSQFASRTEKLEDLFKYKNGRDKPSNIRAALLTIAALMLTVTYQAVLNPPGGLWQDNGSPVTPKRNAGESILASPPTSQGQESKFHETLTIGKSILASQNRVTFGYFVFGNSLGFYTAAYTICFLTRGFPMQWQLIFSMFAIGMTYPAALCGIIPRTDDGLMCGIFCILLAFSLPCIFKLLWKISHWKRYSSRNDIP